MFLFVIKVREKCKNELFSLAVKVGNTVTGEIILF